MAQTGQTFRLLLRMLADLSEGHKGNVLWITTSAREATRVVKAAHDICTLAGVGDARIDEKRRVLTLPNGRTATFRGPTTGEDVMAEKGHVLLRYYDGGK